MYWNIRLKVKEMSIVGKIQYYFARFLDRRPVAVYGSIVDKTASVGNGAQIYNSKIGRYTYVFNSKVINTDVGGFCSIAEDCTIGGGAHPISWISTSPAFYSGKNSLHVNFSENEFNEYLRTTIGNDVWIGSKCLVKGGVTIGDGAIIGMGSVVTHDVPPYEIWAGNPARLIRERFDAETVRKLLDLCWWNWDENKLRELGDTFSSPEDFLGRCK